MEYLRHIIYLRDLGVVKSNIEALESISRPKDVS